MESTTDHQHEDTNSAPPKKRTWKRFLKYLLLIPVALVALIAIRFKMDANIDYDVSTENVTIPKFAEVEIDFEHVYKKATSIQTAGGAIVNVDNQGAEEVFLGGGEGQDDRLFRFVHGKFMDITSEVGFEKTETDATLSATSLDLSLIHI